MKIWHLIWSKIGLIVLVIAVALTWWFVVDSNNTDPDTMTLTPGELVQEVSISGRVVPATSASLALKKSGRVAKILVETGDLVWADQTILSLENNDEVRAIEDARLSLVDAELKLEKLISPIDQQIEEGKLTKAREDGLSETTSVYNDLYSILDGLDKILFGEDFTDSGQQKNVTYYAEVLDFYDLNLNSLPTDLTLAYNQTVKDYDLAFAAYQAVSRGGVDNVTADRAIILTTNLVRDTLGIAKKARDLLQFFKDRSIADNWQSIYKTTVDSHLNSLAVYFDTLNVHWLELVDVANVINTQRNTLTVNDLDLRTQKLEIEKQMNALREVEDHLEDSYLKVPFAGVITEIIPERGEIITANTPIVSLISGDNLEIESYIPEINIALIKSGDPVTVTLDAYGDEVEFNAAVITIDPAETIRDGVSTYKTTLRFTVQDPRIKSGMTVNATITTARQADVLLVPEGVILNRSEQKFVWIKKGEVVEEREVAVGRRSSTGEIEILSGLEVGEKILLQVAS